MYKKLKYIKYKMKNNTYITHIHYLYENEISDKTSMKF